MQKRLNQSICRLGCGLRWAEGSTSLIVCACWRQCDLMGGHIGARWGLRLSRRLRWRCGFMWNTLISLKRSSLQPKSLQTVYRTRVRVRPIDNKSGDLGLTVAYFSEEQNFSSRDISVGAQRNLVAALGVWPIENYFPNFMNFGPGVP